MSYNLQEIQTEALALVQANQFPAINTQADFASAGDVLKVIKNKIAAIEIKRKSYTYPLLKQQKLIKADFDKAAEPYVQFMDELETKMKQFYAIEKARVDEEQAKLDADGAANAGADGVLVPIVNDIKSNRGDLAITTMRTLTRWRVVDDRMVERQFLCVDEKALDAWVKEGKPCPEGIEYFEELSLTSR